MMQSQKTYRVSCAGALRPWGTCCSSASCDGQDGRLFSCEKVPFCCGRDFCMICAMNSGAMDYGGGTGICPSKESLNLSGLP